MDKPLEKIDVFDIQAPSGLSYRISMRQALMGSWISFDKSRAWEHGTVIRKLVWVSDPSQVNDLIEQIESE